MPQFADDKWSRRAGAARFALGAALVIAGCGLPQTRAGEDAPPPALTNAELRPVVDGNQRLGRSVVPAAYTLALDLDPSRASFSGFVAIEVDVARETREVRMHGGDLDIERASISVDGRVVAATPVSGANGGLALHFASPIGPGRGLLELAWTGALGESPAGIYRVEEAGAWYLFSQFQPLSARNAFPCFDQPEFKTPWDVEVRAPAGLLALSSGREIRTRREGALDIHRYAVTRPLPTYLLAFAVGPLERLSVSEGGDGEPPIGIVFTRGKRDLADYAAAHTPKILGFLTSYFGMPYPFGKLDLVAVPNFAMGAMENVGLVTFRETVLLLDQDAAPPWDQRASQNIIAHELAHMWFGDLVTMAWWDDVWLNESFATWMATKATDALSPELEVDLEAVADTQWVMGLDAKRDARSIRQPIRSGGDVYNAFDGISYQKGAAVLRMLESWTGEQAFREGVRRYLAAHADGSGGTAELLGTLDEVTEQPVSTTVARFLDEPGTPWLRIAPHCDAAGDLELDVVQERYLPAGSDAAQGGPWTVPVCVAIGSSNGARGRSCFLLSEASQRFSVVASGSTCPSWLYPNADERGYYRWSLPTADLRDLATIHRDALTRAERVALPGHLAALLEADALDVDDFGEALTGLAADDHPRVVADVARRIAGLYDTVVTGGGDELEEAYAHYARELLSPSIARIGVAPRPGEPPRVKMLRAALLPVAARVGRDASVAGQASEVAERFLSAPASVDEESVALFLPLAARGGDAAFWEQLVDRLSAAGGPSTPSVRHAIVRALGRFDDPALLARSLGLVLDGRLRAQDFRTLAWSVDSRWTGVLWTWIADHHDDLSNRLDPMTARSLPHFASRLCSEDAAREVQADVAGFGDRAEGTDRNLALAVEDIEQCARLRARTQEPLGVWLEARSPRGAEATGSRSR